MVKDFTEFLEIEEVEATWTYGPENSSILARYMNLSAFIIKTGYLNTVKFDAVIQ